MRIREIRVNRYGPLLDLVLRDVGNFTLIFGENESGKTLLLDAILRFMLSGVSDRKLFGRLDRVEHDPDGYLDLVLGDETRRLPNDGSLPNLLDINAIDLRNVLVVRANDLQVHEGQDKEYYAQISDRLMGIHRKPIQKIREILHDIGRLTSTGKISSTQDNNKLGSRIDDAQNLLQKILNLNERSTDIDLIALEVKILDSVEARKKAEDELELLEQARKRNQYISGNQLLSELEECLASIEELPSVEQDHYDSWRDTQNTLDDSAEALEEGEATLKLRKKALGVKREELKEAKDELDSLLRKEHAVEQIDKAADRYREILEVVAGRQGVEMVLPKTVIALAILFALSIVGLILERATVVLSPLSIILGVLFILAGVALFFTRFQDGKRSRTWEQLRLRAAEQGLKNDNFEGLLAALRNFDGELKLSQDRASDAQTAFEVAESQLEDAEQRIADLEEMVKEADQVLADLKETTGVTTFGALQDAMEERTKLETSQRELLTKLEERFRKADGSDEDKRQVWRERVDELSSFKKAAKGVEYSEDRETELSEQIINLKDSIIEIEDNLDDVREEIAEIASKASKVLLPDEDLPGDTTEDLAVIENELRKFKEEVETRAHLAWNAIEIFKAIQEQEEQKVKGLFGEDDLASKYFRSITDDAYKGVEYEPSDGELKVVLNNGERRRAYALSSGTYDQLYIATRLSLADRILQGEPGFLLLDDPFLTSDSKRLPKQLEVLTNLAKEGWQVIYFSVKDEIRNGLKKSIKDGRVELIELPSIHL